MSGGGGGEGWGGDGGGRQEKVGEVMGGRENQKLESLEKGEES